MPNRSARAALAAAALLVALPAAAQRVPAPAASTPAASTPSALTPVASTSGASTPAGAASPASSPAIVARMQSGALTGTLRKAYDTGILTIGYRAESMPFSYLDPKGRPIGYSVELCQEILEDVRAELDGREIQPRYVQVGAQDRIDRVVDGTIDLECGVTTDNAARRKRVAFSPIIFVSGTKLLVRRDAGLRSYRDLRGRTVVVVEGTTNEAAVDALRRKNALDFRVVQVPDHEAAFSMVQTGQADAWAGDDVLLSGFASQAAQPRAFVVLGEYLSYDPYGIVYRRDDPDFDALVRSTFERLAATRELSYLYNRWFMQRLPFGRRSVGVPMSAQLRSIFETLGLPSD